MGWETDTRTSGKAVIRSTLRLLIRNYFDHTVSRNAAALAYYLLFALFPLLIFISNLLGLFHLDVNAITHTLQRVLPGDVVGLVESYLDHIAQTSSHTLLWFSLVFTVWFPMRAVSGLMDNVRLAYHLEKPERPVAFMIRKLIYTVLLLVVMALTLTLTVFGEHALSYLLDWFARTDIQYEKTMLRLWQYLRFVPAGMLMFTALGALYAVALDQRQPVKTLLPGIAAALASWMIVSVGFSFYVEHFNNYSVIYGTLGAVIVLMMWLYMVAVILILGAELNAALAKVRRRMSLYG